MKDKLLTRVLLPVLGVASVVFLVGCSLFNSPPMADFTAAPNAGEAPLTVDFDASGSTDPDGAIVEYVWDFGDGEAGVGVTINHVFDEVDTYTVVLQVTDSAGDSACTSQDISVVPAGSSPPPPPPAP